MLFISDRKNADGTGKDVPEGTLTGGVNVGLELSVVVASAGVSGGIALNLYADLNDPNNDGKIHFDEFLANLDVSQGNTGLLATFDVYGALTASLDAYVEILFVRHEYRIAEIVLAEFELSDSDVYHDRFGSGGGKDDNHSPAKAVNLGVGPGLHVVTESNSGLSIENSQDVDWFQFELLRGDSSASPAAGGTAWMSATGPSTATSIWKCTTAAA